MISRKLVREKLQEVKKSKTENKYISDVINSISKVLKKEPMQYRFYGAYWWVVKNEMLLAGIDWIDDHIDKEWFDKLDTGDSASNLMAAWLYSEEKINNLEMPSNLAIMDIKGENVEYNISDIFMEELTVI